MKQLACFVGTLIIGAGSLSAAWLDRYPDPQKLYGRDGTTLLPIGRALQFPSRSDSSAQPPTTNAANHFLDLSEFSVTGAFTATVVGQDTLNYGLTNAGEFTGLIYGPPDAYGWIRAFSGSAILGSAYYGDSTIWQIPALGNSDSMDTNLIVNQVNPAYQLPFDQPPVRVNNNSVSGSVAAVAGGGNNLLSSEFIRIEYSLTGPDADYAVLTNQIGPSGDFGPNQIPGLASGTTVYLRAVYTGDTPRPGFPVSAPAAVLVLPEPGALLAGCAALFAAAHRRRQAR